VLVIGCLSGAAVQLTVPVVRGKTEIDLILSLIARKTGSTASLAVTSDSAP
jgi:hypothetical protein